MHKNIVGNKIFVLLSLGIVVLSIIAMFSNYFFQRQTIENNTINYLVNYDDYFEKVINDQANTIHNSFDLLMEKEDIIKNFNNSNKKDLYENIQATFDELHKQNDITHLYFIKPSGEVFLRVHDYEKDSDIIDRYTFLKAKDSKQIFFGLEFGVNKNFTLRFVHPLISNYQLIGYVELGKEIDKIITEVSRKMNLDMIFAIKKDIYTNFNEKLLENFQQTKDYFISYNSIIANDKLLEFIQSNEKIKPISINNKKYVAHKHILKDAAKKELGYKIILIDITKEYNGLLKQSLYYISIMLISTFLMLLIGYFYSKLKRNQINSIFHKLRKSKNKIELLVSKQKILYKNLEKLINLQDNIIILTNGKSLTFANKTFYKFFGFKNLESFKKEYSCICEFFMEDDNYFHLEKIEKKEDWIDEIVKLPEEKQIVLMQNHKSEMFSFNVHINKFEQNLYVVSFTDITKTIQEKESLKEKIYIDNLTNAYNRQYFDDKIKRILELHKENNSLTLFAMFDIDFFKNVNDTFGHDVGDNVLINFVNILKSNSRILSDVLIRWGGEEFLMIIPIKNKDSIHTILENYRNSIENNRFEKIDQITCSIGASVYDETKDAKDVIKEADIALYKSKSTGRNRFTIHK